MGILVVTCRSRRSFHCLGMGILKATSTSCLFFFNVIDTFMGLGIIGLAVYCLIKKIVPTWVDYVLFVIGGVILSVAILSVCGLSCNSPWGLTFSTWMSLPLALATLAFAIIVAAFKKKFEDYVCDHRAELELTEKECKDIKEQIEEHAYIIAGILGGIFLLQVLRFIFSLTMKREYRRSDEKVRDREAEMEEQEGLLAKKTREEETHQKYSDMRDDYR